MNFQIEKKTIQKYCPNLKTKKKFSNLDKNFKKMTTYPN
jgi:hypothetical protein